MSRNLGQAACDRCGGEVVAEEEKRPITRAEAGPYFAEVEHRLFANARCPTCGARYLGWYASPSVNPSVRFHDFDPNRIVDLSYRSTFNDEPGPDDVPAWTPPAPPAPTLPDAMTGFADDCGYDGVAPNVDDLRALLILYLGPDGPNLLPRPDDTKE